MSNHSILADKVSECLYEGMSPRETTDALIAAGVRPPALVIGDPAKLATLPVGSIVLANNEAWTLRWPGNGWTVCPSCEITYCAQDLLDYHGEAVTVLHVPAEAKS